jgi:hypothetical protein
MSLQLLHGPHLKLEPPKPRRKVAPVSWSYGIRINAETATKVDALAAKNGVTRCDVVRSALAHFLDALEGTSNAHIDISASVDSLPSAAPSPAVADRWRGSGGADMQNVRRVNKANKDRKATGKAGERLQD